MSKRKTQPAAKVETKKSRRGLWIGIGVFVLIAAAAGGNSDRDKSAGGTPASIYLTDRARVTSVPTLAAAARTTEEETDVLTNTAVRFNTATDVPTDTPMSTATSAPTDTKSPATAVPFTPDFTPQSGLSVTTAPTTYYVLAEARLRSCAGTTTCEIITTLYAGAPVTVTAFVNGEEVSPGNAVWYLVSYNGSDAYIYSDLVTLTAPAAPVTSGGNSGGSSTSGGNTNTGGSDTLGVRPGNCSTAVAMGMSAEEAGKWSHLNRDPDKDNLACYGD